MMVKGNAGDVVNLDDLLGAGGPDLGDWAMAGKHSVDGVSYAVYQHSGLDAELLVQDVLKVGLIQVRQSAAARAAADIGSAAADRHGLNRSWPTAGGSSAAAIAAPR